MKILTLRKRGNFYNAFDEDAFILHELFGYKCNRDNMAGFPLKSLVKVESALINHKIGYKIIENESVVKEIKGIDNEYNKLLLKARNNIQIENRLSALQRKLDNIPIEKFTRILELIENECK